VRVEHYCKIVGDRSHAERIADAEFGRDFPCRRCDRLPVASIVSPFACDCSSAILGDDDCT
jgi:hypothetical protein